MNPKTQPQIIKDWVELSEVPDSPTHTLKINIRNGNGWVVRKGCVTPLHKIPLYLTTHSFYGSQHTRISKRLQECGFNVELANWDAKH